MLLKRYRHKIKTLEELCEIVGRFPREKTVVMCHGVFDVVHPGHLRHLLYAKSKADILVTSLTSDRHIVKGHYRPHIPQDLRAANLAAFEMVDYVLIDKYPTPLETIQALQPDLFAKGFEYILDGLHPKTAEEEELLKSYGGKMLFTPGDIIYSSSAFINMNEPDVRYEKLATLLEYHQVSFADIERALGEMKEIRVHVVGDTIIDGFNYTSMIGGQTKTPTISVRHESQKDYVGGAAIVAQHLRAAGAQVTLTTLLGADDRKDFTLDVLSKNEIKVNAILDENRPTTYKNAIITDGYRLIKVDTLDNSSINDDCLAQFEKAIDKTDCDVVICSDFRHGIFNRRTIDRLLSVIPPQVFKVADSQVASRWGNITEFRNFDLIAPNEREARFALADQDSGIRPLASKLYDITNCKTLILKLGEKGILTYYNSDHEALDSFFVVSSFVDRVVDCVGAGDALLAYATLALLKGASPVIGSILGAVAAACECEMEGNQPVTPDNVREKLLKLKTYLDSSDFQSIKENETLVT
ncbi:adenylyltransferase/cytidyltransferase family protein [Coxiella endosymbiont of Ornithodoros amblus]|uniref:PfkB family carbohydrate kinase n=1 Tax=Coxiella endosymbiont of Ornithodoros amblus TaxID=1656166 RepID=UPI00244DE466|nr:PfkB family carbohydrate kinase [Coxiella endosymbiont of Ornithodoros amblus]MBW5802276.1 adenylyltransferase/cytidyltransferase family protein [Coxiella endosymbiont of Ornithodoros amblus]